LLNPIMGRLKIGAPTVSHHLKELVNAQLVSTERQGKYLTCSINPEAMQRLEAFFASKTEDAR
jgi:DNA-binding transcriptional ArsR family regulator